MVIILEPRGFGHEVDLSEIVKEVHSRLVDLEGFRYGTARRAHRTTVLRRAC